MTITAPSLTGQMAPGATPTGDIAWTLRTPVGSRTNLHVTQTLSDGQHMDLTSAPQVTASLNGAVIWQRTIMPSVSRNAATGQSTVDFALSSVLLLSHVGTFDTLQITDRSAIDAAYAATGQTLGYVSQGDTLTDTAVVTGSAALFSGSVTLPVATEQLSLIGVNGVAVSGPTHAAIGDTLTYQVLITLPAAAARAFVLTSGGLGAAEPTVFDTAAAPGLPAAGHAQFGTGGSPNPAAPAVMVDGAGALVFDFGTLQPGTRSGTRTVALLYTETLRSVPNIQALGAQVSSSEQNSIGAAMVSSAAPVLFSLDQPTLTLEMASLYVSDINAVFGGSGGPFGYSPFTGQFGGVIGSAGLAAEPFQDTLSHLAAGDLVTFVITVENTAPRAGAYGVTLRDTLPPGFVLPPGGAGISATDGAGNTIGFTGDLFDPNGGLMLDPSVAIAGYDPNSGANIALVTFSLQAADTVPVTGMSLDPVATLVQVAAGPGGVGVTSPSGISATTHVTTGMPVVTLTRVGAGPLNLGDLAMFDVTVTLIPGSVPDLRIDDGLSPSFSLVSAILIRTGSGLTVSSPVSGPGSLYFGAVVDNSDGTVPTAEQVTVEYVARAIAADPSAALSATVSAAPSVSGGARWSTVASGGVSIVGPVLLPRVSAPAVAQAGQLVPITVTLANAAGAASAYGLTLTNMVPAGLTFVPGSVTVSGTRATAQLSGGGVTLAELDGGETLTVTYLANVAASVSAPAFTPAATIMGASGSGYQLAAQTASATIALTAPALAVSLDAARLKVGDVAMIRFTVTLPQGTSPGLHVQDVLPSGFAYVPGSAIVLDGSGAGGTLPAPSVTQMGQAVTLDWGPVTATGSGVVVLAIQATVLGAAVLGPLLDSASVNAGYAGSATASTGLTVINTLPVITSLAATTSILDTQSATPFTALRIADPDLNGQQQQALVIRLDAPAHGTLTNLGGGSYDPASGTYRISGTTVGVTAALAGLTFIPSPHQAAVGTSVITNFALTDTDAAGGITVASTAVSALTANSPPSLSGIWSQQRTTADLAISPFAALTLADPDVGQGGTLTLQMSDPTDGSLSGSLGSYDAAAGTYTMAGQLADLQVAARSLVFTPARAATAQFSVTLNDGAGGVVSDVQTTVQMMPSVDITGIAQHFAAAPGTAFLVASNGTQTLARGEEYHGPVTSLHAQFIYDAGGSVVIVSQTHDVFVKNFSGFAAIQLSTGTNVVDAGPGSNFLVGGTGADTFFLDGTHGDTVWDTIVNFHPGDMATLFGFHAGRSSFMWADQDGAAGYTGRTIHAVLTGAGPVTASLTFAGTTAADTARFVVSTGTIGTVDYLAIVNPA